MAIESVREYLKKWNRDKDIMEFETSSATVELAAQTLGVIPARIAKSISFKDKEGKAFLVVTAGDTKTDNASFKKEFGVKAKMLSVDEALQCLGHAVGGVCPFALPEGVKVFLDESMKRFSTVFPACGSSNSAIELTCEELNEYSKNIRWVSACKVLE